MASAPWTVTTHDHEVRIDVNEAASLDDVETEAIIDALERELARDGVTTVRLDGPVLEVKPVPDGFATLAVKVAGLAERRDMRFQAGPL